MSLKQYTRATVKEKKNRKPHVGKCCTFIAAEAPLGAAIIKVKDTPKELKKPRT